MRRRALARRLRPSGASRGGVRRYNKICGHITKLAHELKDLEPSDPFRITMTEKLLDKLYAMGLISTKKSLEVCERIAVSAFCRYAPRLAGSWAAVAACSAPPHAAARTAGAASLS